MLGVPSWLYYVSHQKYPENQRTSHWPERDMDAYHLLCLFSFGCEFESRAGYFVLNLNTEGTLLSKSFMIKDTSKNYLQYNYMAW